VPETDVSLHRVHGPRPAVVALKISHAQIRGRAFRGMAFHSMARGGYPAITSAIIMSCGLTIRSLPLTLAKS
jgi:hypothetical protein